MQEVIDIYKANGNQLTNEVLYAYYCVKYDNLYGSMTEEQYRLKDEFGTPLFKRHQKLSFADFCYSKVMFTQHGLSFNVERVKAELETYVNSKEKTAAPLYQE